MATIRFPIEAGQILMFARATGDTNPIYQDAAYAADSELGGIIAPPTFVQAGEHYDPDYDRRPKPGEAWFGSGREAVGASGGPQPGEGQSGFHAEQHFEYHRHPNAGEVLYATTREGERWERTGRRGGKLVFSETITEYRDEADQLVITTRFVGVLTERPVDGSEAREGRDDAP